jgi:DNA-binding GntR family transcriptional regulator
MKGNQMSIIIKAVSKNLDLSQNKPLKDLIYEAFRKTIILGDIPAGERINEKEFSEKMNISRTPIRYALKKLTEEELVNHVPGMGVVVKGISIKDAYEIYDIRKSLDTLATTTAMTLMTPADFEELRLHLEICEDLNKKGKVDELLQKFSDFNAFIYEKSQMLRLKSIVTKLQEYLIYFRDISIRSKERRDLALAEHWLVYQGMKTQDAGKIQIITEEHLDRSLNFIVKEMEQRKIDYELN